MEGFGFGFGFVCVLLVILYPYPSSSLPMCTDFRAPMMAKEGLTFCPYKGRVCCNSTKDSQLQKQFEAMNISDSTSADCASAVKSILCATCDQFSANLFKVESKSSSVPVLCDSPDSSLSKQSAASTSFCTDVWDKCQNVSITNSPFAPSLQGASRLPHNTSSRLTDLWQSRTDFCTAFGGSPDPDDKGAQCFNGRPIQLNSTPTSVPPPKGLCLERLGDKGYINMAPHPDGSDRAFFSDLPGRIWLATIPTHASGQPLGVDESTPFVDLTDQVKFDTVFGLMGMAFHPKFTENGRFFASFNCDKETSPTCSGRCGCNSDVGCDPSKIGEDHPCQYHNVVAEYSVNGTASEPAKATKGKPTEVRRILTIGLPFKNNHGGQILFGPDDGYMYIMLGDGGGRDGPFMLAQNKKSLLGKIMRVDVDTTPKEEEDVNLWGNYSIPHDNPYSEDKEMLPEIWALGLRNPWRCSFDSQRPSYFLCTDIGQDRYEEIDVITKGGNYGWSMYEGHLPVDSSQKTLTNSSSTTSTDVIFPAMGYSHRDVNKNEGSAAITGGAFYRSTTDPCMYGSYLYADLYAKALWAASETPTNSGNFTSTSIPFGCARDSPLECSSVPNTNLADLGFIYSFGEDNKKEVYILASKGVYRVVKPSRCNYSCKKEEENGTQIQTPTLPPPPSSSTSTNHHLGESSVLYYMCLIVLLVGHNMLQL